MAFFINTKKNYIRLPKKYYRFRNKTYLWSVRNVHILADSCRSRSESYRYHRQVVRLVIAFIPRNYRNINPN